MKLSELKKRINELPSECDDMDVRVWADHGQHFMVSGYVSIEKAYEDEYMLECVLDEDGTDDSDAYHFVCIGA